jgi:hypothetical protein
VKREGVEMGAERIRAESNGYKRMGVGAERIGAERVGAERKRLTMV